LKAIRPVHLEIQTHRARPVGVLRSSFREGGKIKHTNHGRLTGLALDQLKLIQAAFRGEVVPKDSPQAFQTLDSREYGASYALLQLAKDLELDRALYSRNEPWVQDCLAMIVGRVVYAGSKLALSNQWKNTALWELCGVDGPVDVEEHCYLPMDRLLERQRAIQRTLASKHLKNGHLVLYDITSTYFEGAYVESEIVLFGYNRDGKKGHEQVVLGCCAMPRLPGRSRSLRRQYPGCEHGVGEDPGVETGLRVEGSHLRRGSWNGDTGQRGGTQSSQRVAHDFGADASSDPRISGAKGHSGGVIR
jgi:hypothetical protein